MKICPQCGDAYDDTIEACAVDRSKLIAIDASDGDPMLGKLLAGRYRLVRKIGEGGMGAIYRAIHTEMSRTCAIKLLTALSPGKEDAIARFKREAKMASRIDNVHAVTIYDFGQTDDGMLFLAMEFIDGRPLSRLISEQRVLPIERVVNITNQIALALSAAHALGIVHRDLKPDNIMVTRKGSENDFVKVLDFGIAKTVADDSADNLTKTGFVLGTPVYMSPEQLLGEKLDPRSDIYSLAIIVYEMLCGKLPFDGDNPQAVMMKRVMSDPIRLSTIAPSLGESIENAVMSGLQRNRDTRTPTVEAFAAELSQTTQGGTQILGGVVTGRLAETGAGRATGQWGSQDTRVDSSPPFTGSTDARRTSQGGGADTWGATEITQSPARPLSERQTLPQSDGQPQLLSQQAPLQGSTRAAQTVPDLNDGLDAMSPANSSAVISEPEPRRRGWIWLVSAFVIAIIGVIGYLLWPSSAAPARGFALVVKGAPVGSQVYVNDALHESAASDGTIKVSGIDPGSVNIRVSHEGFTDFMTTLTGAKGEIQTCEAALLPTEIDYKGKMAPIPAGEFVMGDDSHEADEKPAHKVALPSYYIDKYEVTNAQYKKFCDETKRTHPPDPDFDPGYFTTKPEYPVLGVTFEDALAFASWTGKRLPTEPEWEKAASWDAVARKKRIYPWGDSFASDRANIATGQPVAATETRGDSSAFGVFNLGGNAWEWVDAAYKPYDGNRVPDADYNKDERVVRGGTFLKVSNPVEEARTSYRNHLPRVFPTGKSISVGFRCVVSANDSRIEPLLRAASR